MLVDVGRTGRGIGPVTAVVGTPLGELNGVFSYSDGYLFTSCTTAGRTTTLDTTVSGRAPATTSRQEIDARSRTIARLLVDAANRANDRLGCRDDPVRLPDSLPPRPQPEPLADAQQVCGLLPRSVLPELDNNPDSWIQLRPPANGILDTCQIGHPDTDPRMQIHTEVSFTVSRGPLAETLRSDAVYLIPEFDTTCRGEPVSYRMELFNEVGIPRFDERQTLHPRAHNLLAQFAAAHAQRDGCPIPPGAS